ncbi:unnamed protein product [Orchesella dallaii]|uniref:Tetratricopeptide repeat protein 21B n=1 Tax=Orchesella dallaii TaxID=48710 RepID=A0ABP1S268_9HEXA
MEVSLEYSSRLNHACREGYYQEMHNISEEAVKRFPNEPVFKFYRAISLVMSKRTNEALRALEPLQHESPVQLGACLASISAHRSCVQVDRESVASLEAKVRDGRKSSPPNELYHAGLFMCLLGKPEKAKEYLDRAIKQAGNHLDAICIRGWVEMKLSQKDKSQKAPVEFFEAVLRENRKHLDALLGISAYYGLCHQFETALEKLNFALAVVPNWIPALTEKMKTVLSLQDWDQAVDIANRILGIEENLEARRLLILHTLCRQGNLDTVPRALSTFLSLCKSLETNNARYFIENARVFSQLSSYKPEIVSEAIKFAKYATELEMDNADFVAEVGQLLLLLGKVKEAYQEFKLATNMDNTSMLALYGLISCQLADGNVEMAAQQLEFLRELTASIEKPAELAYLSAVVAKQKNLPAEAILKYLNEALEAHFARMRGLAFNMSYLKLINPDLVLKIVREYLLFAPQEPVGVGMVPPACVRQAAMILETVIKVCPCHRDTLFISSQIQYLSGDFRSSVAILNRVLNIDSSMIEVYLLMAQVHIAQNEFDAASHALDNGLSCNFKIREHPKYQLLLAKVQRQRGENDKALKQLQDALVLIQSGRGILSENQNSPVDFGLSDKMALYMELIAVLRQLGKSEDANVIMQDALGEFKGTHLEGRISLTQAEEMVEKGEVDKALALLKSVQPNQNHYVESRKLMSEIYLNYRRNNEQYTSCFVDIANHNPTPQNLIMLADAYMNIQEPEKAIEIYEVALAKNPRDATLASKMGQALVLTHQYSKAVNYYKEAVKNDDNFSLRYDLATLHLKLKQYDKAEKTIQQALSDAKDGSLTSLIMEVKLLILLAKVLQGGGNANLAQQSLVRAKESQNRVLKRVVFEQPSNVEEQKRQFCTISKLLGDVAEKQNEMEFAIKSLKEGLEYCPNDWQCLVVLSKLYMKSGDHIHCQQTCQQLVKLKSGSAEASVMLGELFFRKFDFQSASFHFQQYLDHNPMHWQSLMWFIECCRRSGTLNEAEPYLKAATTNADPNDPGLGYCQGIYEWYSGNANMGLKMLNKARKDPVYGPKALLVMIDIYVNPTGGVLGGDALDSTTAENGSGDKADYRDLTLNTAETLIRELNAKSTEEKFRRHVLECFVLLASKNKNKMEKAVQELSGLVTTELGRESVMLVYALSTGYMFLKQTPRARNQLKRVVKAPWTVEDAEYLERCWLLLSDVYIQSSKFDLATDLIKKVLNFNKSCVKAYEYLGYIMEKEQAYADAAVNYEAAWKLTNNTNPAMGYKLAFNYLKAKRNTDAIDVCHMVLAKHPTYPKIKKEIMDKARAGLRV